MKKYSLVTGGAGFIGSHVVKLLVESGNNVVVIDDLSGGFKDNIHKDAVFKQGSITDVEFVQEIFSEFKIEYIYHLAAYAAEGLSHFIRRFNYNNNLIGSINLINSAVNNKVKCFVFTSSIAVYGDNALPLEENQHPKPEDPYGIAKYAVEMDLENAKKLFDLNYIIFRPHNVYGANQNIGDKYRNVVGIFMNQILKNEKLSIFGDGNQTRAFTYIDDVAPYIANSVNIPEAHNKTFNIGNDSVNSVSELANTVKKILKSNSEITYNNKREEAVHAYSNHSKFKSVFKPKSETDLVDGLIKMADWVKINGSRTSSSFGNIEIEDKLPTSWK